MYIIYKSISGEVVKFIDSDKATAELNTPVDCSYIEYLDEPKDGYINNKVFIPFENSNEDLTFDYTTKKWVNLKSLLEVKQHKWQKIKELRTLAEEAGFVWNGQLFDSDFVSQTRIANAITLAQINPAFSVLWTLKDNTVCALTQQSMLQVGLALGAHIAKQFNLARELRTTIDKATTKTAIEAVEWPK